MKLDTKQLKELCAAVIRDIGNDGDVPMGLDWGWANLCRESLPKLKAFLRALEHGGQAFPVPDFTGGMSLRDWFAGKALQGLLACPKTEGKHQEFAADSVKYADAMIAVLAEATASGKPG